MTKTLEKQIEDWTRIRDLCIKAQTQTRIERPKTLKLLYKEIREYYNLYKTKFDYTNPPQIIKHL